MHIRSARTRGWLWQLGSTNAQGTQQFVDQQKTSMPLPDDPLEALKAVMHFFVEFCAADFARYQLLFQRTILGFEPSPA